jgi:hypothetical protein
MGGRTRPYLQFARRWVDVVSGQSSAFKSLCPVLKDPLPRRHHRLRLVRGFHGGRSPLHDTIL